MPTPGDGKSNWRFATANVNEAEKVRASGNGRIASNCFSWSRSPMVFYGPSCIRCLNHCGSGSYAIGAIAQDNGAVKPRHRSIVFAGLLAVCGKIMTHATFWSFPQVRDDSCCGCCRCYSSTIEINSHEEQAGEKCSMGKGL